MTRSISEVEAEARKAARGAGYPWGLADEAGFAVCWLEARGYGGIHAFAQHLKAVEGNDVRACAPRSIDDLSAQGPLLCPISLGTTLSDLCPITDTTGTTIAAVSAPLLVAPFLAHVAALRGSVLIKTPEAEMRIGPDGIEVSGQCPTTPTDITLHKAGADVPPSTRRTRLDPDTDDWRILKRFAGRTYAPATEASRLKGAGAGLNDND